MFVNLSLMDINDNKLVFSKGFYYVVVKEILKVGSDVFIVWVSDIDVGM